MPTSPLDALATSLDGVTELLSGFGPDEWALPTPCSGWDVRALAGHLVGGNLLVAGALRGDPMPAPDQGRRPPEDVLGADAVAAFRDSAAAVLAGFGAPGALERTVRLPAGELPGMAAVHLRVVENLVHGWDLATAAGRTAPFPDALAAAELEFSRDLLGRLPAGRQPFAPPQPVDDGAPALDRLAALLGRRVDQPLR